jgi:hypothetical protein
MTAWHDKFETSVRLVERQLAALKLGTTLNNGTLQMNDEEIARALSTSQPSELFIKGVIASEVREMENAIEDKVEARVRSAMRSEVQDSQKIIRVELRGKLI